MTGFLGMDTAAVRLVSARTTAASTRLVEILDACSRLVEQAEWNGPDAEAFRVRFAAHVRRPGARAAAVLAARAHDLSAQAEEQDRVSGDDGVPRDRRSGDGGSDGASRHSDALGALSSLSLMGRGPSAPATGVVGEAVGELRTPLFRAVGETGGSLSDLLGVTDAVKPISKSVQPVEESDIDRHPEGIVEPHSVHDLLRNLDRAGNGERHTDDHANITVQKIRGEDGKDHYVVYVPGSHGPKVDLGQPLHEGTNNPMGWDQNGAALIGLPTDSSEAVKEAMDAYGVPRGSDVTLVGHSQGGIAVSNLAADRSFNGEDGYRVSSVVTAGSPVENAPVPYSTKTINFDHQGPYGIGNDPVANLDGDLLSTARFPGPVGDLSNRHEVSLYGRTEFATNAHGVDLYAQSVQDDVRRLPFGATARFERDQLGNILGPDAHAVDGADVPVTRR